MVEAAGGGGGGGADAAGRRWRLADEGCGLRAAETEYVRLFHRHEPCAHQCSSAVAKHIKAPVHLVWSLVRRFDQPQLFKPFVSRCEMKGNIEIGSVREVNVKSGLPATRSTERLELLDDNEHILSVRTTASLMAKGSSNHLCFPISMVAQMALVTCTAPGKWKTLNYSSILTVHPEVIDGRPGTLVIESFVVDVPEGNTKDETCYFVEALLKCNLKSLAEVSERLVVKDQTEPLDR
ncbi:hypothetical protein ABZP36_031651 [Zizania latifolia]